MTESVNSPATQPIQDKAPKPPGLMPKNVQTWAMLGLAVLMVSIMWLTGGKKDQTLRKSGTSSVQTPVPLEVNEGKIAELQNRIQELQREQQVALNEQNKFFGAVQSDNQSVPTTQIENPQAGSPQTTDPIQDERRKRAYLSMFSSNVALSYRKELAQPGRLRTLPPPQIIPSTCLVLRHRTQISTRNSPRSSKDCRPHSSPFHRLSREPLAQRGQPQPKKQKGTLPRVPRKKPYQTQMHSMPPRGKTTSSLKERSLKPYF